MNNIFGHNGKQSIGRLICSGPRIGSNQTWLPSRPSQLGTADHSRSLEVSLLSHLCQLGTKSNIPTLLKIVFHRHWFLESPSEHMGQGNSRNKQIGDMKTKKVEASNAYLL